MKINRTQNLLVCRSVLFVLIAVSLCFSSAHAQWTTSGNDISNTNSGNVGVGTATPSSLLEVKKDQATGTEIRVNNSSTSGFAGIYFNGGFAQAAGGFVQWKNVTGQNNLFLGTGGSVPLYLGTNNTPRFTILPTSGNVGIGTMNPADPLHVYGTTNSVGTIRVQGGNTVAGFIGVWDFGPMLLLSNNRHPGTANNYKTTSAGSMIVLGAESNPGDIAFYTTSSGTTPTNNDLVRMKANGRVGIGTITPGYQLDVQGGSINSSGGLCIAGDCKTAWSQISGSWQWTTSGTTINYAGGNVGIATATPTEKLDVTGNVKVTGNMTVSGNIAAKYQDVAEWVPAAEQFAAGTVVVLDSAKSNQVISSCKSYDTRVAGVISAQPGIMLGEKGDGKVLVATTGRVLVNVDATSGPIEIGDLLVTSDREGVAMKSQPVDIGGVRIHRPGTLIGKALEPLATGTGKILVLLSLQ